MKLVVVESPNKVAKIRSFLGPDFRVSASFGHVADLPPTGGLGVRFHDGKVEPHYEPLERAQKRIAELKSMAANAESILVATDPDREGEAIGWHVARLLGALDRCERVVFNQVTARAVQAAVANPRTIDLALVDAQQARRVLDRVVGWVVSPTLRNGCGREARSAGRVQSVALRLVAEREREIQQHEAVTYFTLDADLLASDQPPPFTARLVRWKGEPLHHRLAERKTAEQTVAWCREQAWRVLSRDSREAQRKPPPPFITATVQQAASVRLKMTPDVCMKQLQSLFEAGHITYHRTDSEALAPEAIDAARSVIRERYDSTYLPDKPVIHASRDPKAQEAHEAIRPTHPETGPTAVTGDTATLYQLIWERFIACQMANGRDHLTTIRIAVAPESWRHPELGPIAMGELEAKGKIVVFDGWRRLTEDTTEERKTKRKTKSKKPTDDDDDGDGNVLPDVQPGEDLTLVELRAVERSTKAPPRYTQASLIKKLKAVGVGRPSTYASILTTLLARKYVSERQRKLHATDLGLRVIDFLVRHFKGDFIDVDYTARMEDQLDAIARGDLAWEGAVTGAATQVRDRAKAAGLAGDPLSDEPEQRQLGQAAEGHQCPLCGGGMTHRVSRYGPFLACNDRSCPAICNPDGSPSRKTAAELAKRNGSPSQQPSADARSARATRSSTSGKPSKATKRETGSPSAAPKQRTPRTSAKAPRQRAQPPTTDDQQPPEPPPRAAADATSPACPECGAGMLSEQRDGKPWWVCERMPSCFGERPGSD